MTQLAAAPACVGGCQEGEGWASQAAHRVSRAAIPSVWQASTAQVPEQNTSLQGMWCKRVKPMYFPLLGFIQTSFGQCKIWRSCLIPVCVSCLQRPLHYLYSCHPLFYQSGVLELFWHHSLGEPLRIFNSLIEWVDGGWSHTAQGGGGCQKLATGGSCKPLPYGAVFPSSQPNY